MLALLGLLLAGAEPSSYCKDNPINGGKHLDSDCPAVKGGVKLSQAADDTEAALAKPIHGRRQLAFGFAGQPQHAR